MKKKVERREWKCLRRECDVIDVEYCPPVQVPASTMGVIFYIPVEHLSLFSSIT
jgi:hypothetical protein